MKLSQLTRRMDRDDGIVVTDMNRAIDQSVLYDGKVRGIKRDDEINGAFVEVVKAVDSTVHVLVSCPHDARKR